MTKTYTGREGIDSFSSAGDLFAVPFNKPNVYTASRVLTLEDLGRPVLMDLGSSNSVTIAPDGGSPFPDNAFLLIGQKGAGLTTLVEGSGVTIRSRGGFKAFAGQYAMVGLLKIGANEWWAYGGLATS